MATTITITTTDEQDAAIDYRVAQLNIQRALVEKTTGQVLEPLERVGYLTSQIQEVLADWLQQYRVATAPITPEQGIAAFAAATPEQQAAALAALGVQLEGQTT